MQGKDRFPPSTKANSIRGDTKSVTRPVLHEVHSGWFQKYFEKVFQVFFEKMNEDIDDVQSPPAKRPRMSRSEDEKEAQAAQRREQARLAMARKRSLETVEEAAARRDRNQEDGEPSLGRNG